MDSSALKVLDERVSKLTAAYEGTTGEQARHVAEELNQLTMLSEVLKEIDAKTSAKPHPELELLRSKLESAASKLIAIDWADPERNELANDIAALLMLAHSVNRHER